MVEVVRTNFAPIFFQVLKIFPIVAQPSNNFQICSIRWKGLFFPEKKRCKLHLNRPTTDCLLLNNATASLATVMHPSVIYEQKVKNITLHPLSRRASYDFHQILHDDRGGLCHHFILKLFWVPSIL